MLLGLETGFLLKVLASCVAHEAGVSCKSGNVRTGMRVAALGAPTQVDERTCEPDPIAERVMPSMHARELRSLHIVLVAWLVHAKVPGVKQTTRISSQTPIRSVALNGVFERLV